MLNTVLQVSLTKTYRNKILKADHQNQARNASPPWIWQRIY
ncbi:MAG: hypothetical protein MRECE_1c102 [Mycoplasmataceae bacterium CE_OT135]|nr:MAG: hypothetical protein MRECE_1c065 [Mycoplasmataceae bacterium CE_OT135]KLL04340.1 MAG: hypothetical protein MRECE_1c102 [Mycoplasmataceae bacterium CE_OT135]